MEYVFDLILKQKEYIEKFINQSHILYIQPDMEKGLSFNFVCDYDEDYISDDPFINNKRKFDVNFHTDIDNVQGTLDELHGDMFGLIHGECDEEYDIVRIYKLYFSIGICIYP